MRVSNQNYTINDNIFIRYDVTLFIDYSELTLHNPHPITIVIVLYNYYVIDVANVTAVTGCYYYPPYAHPREDYRLYTAMVRHSHTVLLF